MGLDSVELVLEVAETFGIHIEDQEAERARTVGDLHQLVISKLAPVDSARCLTSAAFFRTRRALVSALGVGRREVRRDSGWMKSQMSLNEELWLGHMKGCASARRKPHAGDGSVRRGVQPALMAAP